jgi:SAM-dependent methyltransferase
MNPSLKKALKKAIASVPFLRPLLARPRIPHGPEGIRKAGHRRYIGGMWEEIGKLQFDFLVQQGLKPQHYFVDVACGSLRAGVHLIPYLEPGHYLGIEKEPELIEAGMEKEISPEIAKAKQPEFVVSDSFEFEKFSKVPDYGIAQSLFTHLPPAVIDLCFAKLRGHFSPDGVFYATYFESAEPVKNPDEPHDHGFFVYTRDHMLEFGTRNGWNAEYIGNWNHPRDQVIVKYTLQG